MVHLLIGPSNAGKSTWITHTQPKKFGFAFQFVDGGLPDIDSVLHDYLLFLAPALKSRGDDIHVWQLLEDTLLERLLTEGHVGQATVIVAPITQLLARAKRRKVVEDHQPDRSEYNAKLWLPILQAVNHSAMYLQLFDLLDDHSVPIRVLYNDEHAKGGMREADRRDVVRALYS